MDFLWLMTISHFTEAALGGPLTTVVITDPTSNFPFCTWYAVVSSAFTLGLLAGSACALQLSVWLNDHHLHFAPLDRSGDYGHELLQGDLITEPSLFIWAFQVGHWCVCYLCGVGSAFLLLFLCAPLLLGLATFLDRHAVTGLGALLMVLWPLALGGAQALFVDKLLALKVRTAALGGLRMDYTHVYDSCSDGSNGPEEERAFHDREPLDVLVEMGTEMGPFAQNGNAANRHDLSYND